MIDHVVCTRQHFMPGTWQNDEFRLEYVCGHGLDPRISFCTDRVSLHPPAAPMWPVRGRGGRAVQSGYRRVCRNPEHEGLAETPLRPWMALRRRSQSS